MSFYCLSFLQILTTWLSSSSLVIDYCNIFIVCKRSIELSSSSTNLLVSTAGRRSTSIISILWVGGLHSVTFLSRFPLQYSPPPVVCQSSDIPLQVTLNLKVVIFSIASTTPVRRRYSRLRIRCLREIPSIVCCIAHSDMRIVLLLSVMISVP